MKKIEYHVEKIQLPIPWDSEGTPTMSMGTWADQARDAYLAKLNELRVEGWELLQEWRELDASPPTWVLAFFKREAT